MSLIKKHEMTDKHLAANRRNQKLCNGALTDDRRERIRAAHLRHGFYSQAEEVAMRALGEDPAQFQEMVEGLWEEFNPVGSMQEGLVIRLARATWLMNRADRMQEGYAVRQAQEVNRGRQDRLHARMMRIKLTADSLRLLVQAVAREHYVTTPADLEKMKSLQQEGVVKEMAEIAQALFCQLRAPGTDEEGLTAEEQARMMVEQAKEIFGIGTTAQFAPQANGVPSPSEPDPEDSEEEEDAQYPQITAREWELRQRPRQLLENILRRQVEICEEQRQATLKESLRGPSPYERAAEIAPTHPDARLMRRMQDSNFREIRRVTNLLLKIKRYERRMAASQDDEKSGNSDL
ncbi:MAG: hypothetical protein ACLQVL_12675 [Terriglobia bacterium]